MARWTWFTYCSSFNHHMAHQSSVSPSHTIFSRLLDVVESASSEIKATIELFKFSEIVYLPVSLRMADFMCLSSTEYRGLLQLRCRITKFPLWVYPRSLGYALRSVERPRANVEVLWRKCRKVQLRGVWRDAVLFALGDLAVV